MKVLLINGSPHAHGCTATALNEVAKTLNENGVETELIQVGHLDVRGCIACGQCRKLGHCVFNDIVCEVDMKSSSEIAEGQILMPVKVYDPMGRLIWAKGNYEVVVSISAATEEPAE